MSIMEHISQMFDNIHEHVGEFYNTISGIPQWIEVAIKYSIKHHDFIDSILQFFQDNPGLGTAIIVGGTLMLTIPLAIGFGSGGVTIGSLAAAWQSSIGNVAAGSLFAILQSITMTGVLATVGQTMVVAGMVVKLLGMKGWNCVLKGEPMGFVLELV